MAEEDERQPQGGLEGLQADLSRALQGTAPWHEAFGKNARQPGLTQEQKEEQYQLALTIAQPFMGEAGRASLAELRRRTIEQPVFPFKSVDAGLLPYYGCGREGQNMMVRWIEHCIRVVEEGPPVAPEGKSDGEE